MSSNNAGTLLKTLTEFRPVPKRRKTVDCASVLKANNVEDRNSVIAKSQQLRTPSPEPVIPNPTDNISNLDISNLDISNLEYKHLRTETEVTNILKQWRHFRSNRRYTDLTVHCGRAKKKSNNNNNSLPGSKSSGPGSLGGITLHRLVLASCSSFMAELLKDREEAVLVLPDVQEMDFANLVQVKRVLWDPKDPKFELLYF